MNNKSFDSRVLLVYDILEKVVMLYTGRILCHTVEAFMTALKIYGPICGAPLISRTWLNFPLCTSLGGTGGKHWMWRGKELGTRPTPWIDGLRARSFFPSRGFPDDRR